MWHLFMWHLFRFAHTLSIGITTPARSLPHPSKEPVRPCLRYGAQTNKNFMIEIMSCKKKKKKSCSYQHANKQQERDTQIREKQLHCLLKSHHPETQHHALYNGGLLTCIPRFHILEPLLEDSRIMFPEDHGLQQFLCIENQCPSQSY
jgi:hypothetical protein